MDHGLDVRSGGGSLSGPEIPFLKGTDAELAELRSLLTEVGYTEPVICARLDISNIFEVATAQPDDLPPADAVDVLLRLFAAGIPVTAELAEELLPERLAELIGACGLVRTVADPPRVVPNVSLFPIRDTLTAADVDHDPLVPIGTKSQLRSDAVYPGNTEHTGAFLQILPDGPCDALLDLCSGTAIAALLDRGAREAVAIDVTDRATHFAEFNVRLNRASHVRPLKGDLWDAVPGKTFDRIVAHPPWVPNVGADFVYRAGGDDGEQITRRIVEGLPEHLRVGGTFYASCMVTDRQAAPAETRLREMLGDAESEFDIVLVARAVSTPTEYYAGQPGPRSEDGSRHVGAVRLEEIGVTELVLSSFAIRRHGRAGSGAVTARRTAGGSVDNGQIEWLLDWEARLLDPNLPAAMVGWRPLISPDVRLELHSHAQDGGWVAERCVIEVSQPFLRTIELPLPIAQFLATFDGRATVAERVMEGQRMGVVPEGVTPEQFAVTLLPLFSSSVLLEG